MATTAVKQSRKGRQVQREIEESEARLRKYLSKLVPATTKPGGGTYDYKPRMTFRMFCIFMRIDSAMVGTPDYAGIAYWWDGEYKHTLRDASPKERKKAHDAILAAGLALDGVSDEHAQIIDWATNNGKRASEAMGCKWTPYRGPRPTKRKAAR